MVVGPRSIALVELRRGAVECNAFKTRLELVLQVMNNSAIGVGLGLPSIEEIGYGSNGHLKALDAIEEQLRATRAAIAEQNAKEAAADKCTDCGTDLSHAVAMLCDEDDGQRCGDCFTKHPCGKGEHGEGCATQMFRGD